MFSGIMNFFSGGIFRARFLSEKIFYFFTSFKPILGHKSTYFLLYFLINFILLYISPLFSCFYFCLNSARFSIPCSIQDCFIGFLHHPNPRVSQNRLTFFKQIIKDCHPPFSRSSPEPIAGRPTSPANENTPGKELNWFPPGVFSPYLSYYFTTLLL